MSSSQSDAPTAPNPTSAVPVAATSTSSIPLDPHTSSEISKQVTTSKNETTKDEWDEHRYKDSIVRLSDLEKQITALRTALPSLLAPIANAGRRRQELAQLDGTNQSMVDATTEASSDAARSAANKARKMNAIRRVDERRRMFDALRDAATKATGQMAALRADWDSEVTRGILLHAKESDARDSNLEPGRNVVIT